MPLRPSKDSPGSLTICFHCAHLAHAPSRWRARSRTRFTTVTTLRSRNRLTLWWSPLTNSSWLDWPTPPGLHQSSICMTPAAGCRVRKTRRPGTMTDWEKAVPGVPRDGERALRQQRPPQPSPSRGREPHFASEVGSVTKDAPQEMPLCATRRVPHPRNRRRAPTGWRRRDSLRTNAPRRACRPYPFRR